MPRRGWRVGLGDEAERDFAAIVRWTAENFGVAQARRYAAVLEATVAELAGGPEVLGSKARDEVLPGIRTLHVAPKGRRGRHILVYRAGANGTIEVVGVLHDSMEPGRHAPP